MRSGKRAARQTERQCRFSRATLIAMELRDFAIGQTFWTETGEWCCIDIGPRVVVALKVGDDPSSQKFVGETVFEERDFGGCFESEAALKADGAD